jgi:ABC-type transporter Mla subunit MlaD
MDPYHNLFEDSLSLRSKKKRKAGFSTPGVIGVIALLVVLFAVWWLFDNNNNTAQNGDFVPSTVIPGEPRDTFNNDGNRITDNEIENNLRLAQTEARRDLMSAQARLQSNQNYQEALTSVAALRANLERAYVSTTTATSTIATTTQALRDEWNSLKVQLDE